MGRCRYIGTQSKIPGRGKYNDKGKCDDPSRTFQRDYRSNYRGVNCAEWVEGGVIMRSITMEIMIIRIIRGVIL